MKISSKLILTALVLLGLATGLVAQTVYSFKCPKCGLIQTYSTWGIYKCPNDGAFLVKK